MIKLFSEKNPKPKDKKEDKDKLEKEKPKEYTIPYNVNNKFKGNK